MVRRTRLKTDRNLPAPAGLSDALAMLETIAEQARSAPDGDLAYTSSAWLHGFLSTLSPDGLATAERHAERVRLARELLPLLAVGEGVAGGRSSPRPQWIVGGWGST